MKKKNWFMFVIISSLIGVLLIPAPAFSIYTGKTKQGKPEFSPTRLIVKLKPKVDKQVTLGRVQGKITTGLAN